ncbi:MAG: pyocin activator PrtN family protein [Rhizobiales bacterium]|nr:pyocin activator PrtN family protein [Hyphomicrobiales bacterium]NRB13062.1 pyocin activator PrtN family protein [Hyphomicrobiales bacterium]
MNTHFMLLAQFEKPVIPLIEVCKEYFNMSTHTACNRAKCGTLPVPAFRLGKSQKHPWLIHLNDLADLIDTQAAEAKREHVG